MPEVVTKTRTAPRTAARPKRVAPRAKSASRPAQPAARGAARPARRSWRGGRKVRPAQLATTMSQLADLLDSGVPLMRSLEVLAGQAAETRLGEVLADVKQQVSEGATLDAAFARHRDVFNDLVISMVRAGGEGGFLEDVLKRTADFIEEQEDLKSRVIGAVTYPVLLGIAALLATTVLIVFFVPKFAELFARLEERGELPFLTIALLWTSDTLRSYGVFILAGSIAAGVWIARQLKTVRGRTLSDHMRLRVPVAGPVYLNLAVARFCRVLGTLLRNGVPILRSLEISSDSTGNLVLSAAIRRAAENITSGQTLSGPLAACGLFPKTVVEMISVAEESNSLERVLIDVADGLERRTQRQLDLMVRLLEPLMLLIMASVILVVVIALLLPVFQMSATIG